MPGHCRVRLPFQCLPGLPVVALVVACGVAAPPAVVRVDSAGVEIVRSEGPQWAPGQEWQVEPEPFVSVGRLEGDAPYLFGDVVGAARLEDGGIVVGDGQGLVLRYFDSAGVFVREVGGRGAGPEEFGSLQKLRRCGKNRILASDFSARRVRVWSDSGTGLGVLRLLEPTPAAERQVRRWECSPTGEFVVAGWFSGSFGTYPRSQIVRRATPLWTLDTAGQPVAALEDSATTEWGYLKSASGRGGSGFPHPWGRDIAIATAGGRVFLSGQEGLAVDVYDADTGARRASFRAPADDVPVTPEILARYREDGPATMPEPLRARFFDAEMEHPTVLPGLAAILLDPDGHIWAQRFHLPWEPAQRWAVFAPDGAFLGHVAMPPGLEVREIGRDYVLGVHRDELDVERVRLHRLLPVRDAGQL